MNQQTHTASRARHTPLVPPGQLPRLRLRLEDQRRFRLDQIDELAAKAAEAALIADEARWQVNRALTVAAEWALGDINTALSRLEHGTYGICERCTEPIQLERLTVLPMSRLCVACQYRDARLARSGVTPPSLSD